MVRRAGLIDSPDGGGVQTPNLQGGVPGQVTQTYVDLAKTADAIGQTIFKPMVDQETRQRAMEAVARGEFRTTDGWTQQDQLYDKIVDAGFMANASTDMDRMFGEIETKRMEDLDVSELQKDLAAARTSYLGKLPTKYAVPLGQAWDQQAVRTVDRISGLGVQRGIKLNIDALKTRLSLATDQLAGVSDYGAPEVQGKLEEVESLQAALIKTGTFTQEEADANTAQIFGRFTGNRVSDAGVQHYLDNDRTDDAYYASLKMVDDALSSPDLGLSRSERDTYLGKARSALNAERSQKKAEEAEHNAEVRAMRQEILADFTMEMPGLRDAAKQGYAPSPAKIAELYKTAAALGPSYVNRVRELDMLGGQQDYLRGKSIPEQEGYIQKLEQLANTGDTDAAALLDPARTVASANRRQAEADPATFAALREGRDVPQIDWGGPGFLDTAARRFTSAEDAAQDYGVGVKYFSPADRARLKAIADKGGADAMKIANDLAMAADQAGVNPLAVFDEIDGSGAPLLATAGALLAQGADPDTARKILTGPEAMKTEIVKSQMPDTGQQGRAQRRVFGEAMTRMPKGQIDAITRSADAYYAADVLDNQGQPPGGKTAAYERAMRAVMGETRDESGKTWGGRGKVGEREATVPPWIRQADFPTILRNLNEAELRAGMTGPQISGIGTYGGRPVAPSDFRSAAFIDAGGGRYYIAPDPSHPERLVLSSIGNPVPAMIDLNSIRETLKDRYPSAVK